MKESIAIDGVFRKCMYGAYEGDSEVCSDEATHLVWFRDFVMASTGRYMQRFVCERHLEKPHAKAITINQMIENIRHDSLVQALSDD